MKPQRSGRIAICGGLLVLLFVCLSISSPFIIVVVAPLLIGLLTAELDRSGGLIAVRLVRLASHILPDSHRDLVHEWEDHVLADGEAGLLPVFTAIGISLRAAPRIALGLRAQPAAEAYMYALFATFFNLLRVRARRIEPLSALETARAALSIPVVPLQALLVWRGIRSSHRTVRIPWRLLPLIGGVISGVIWVLPVVLAAVSVTTWIPMVAASAACMVLAVRKPWPVIRALLGLALVLHAEPFTGEHE